MLGDFTPSELCYLMYAYHESGYLPKNFAAEIESLIKKRLVNTEDVSI